MDWKALLPRVPGIELARVEILADQVVVHAATSAPVATCPGCGTPSRRVHSRYVRTLTDRPLGGRAVRHLVTVRRFVCSHTPCPRAIFAEAVDDIAPPRARTTADLTDAHAAIGFAAGGEPGARLARDLDMPTSPDTLLRRVKARNLDPGPPPRYVGVETGPFGRAGTTAPPSSTSSAPASSRCSRGVTARPSRSGCVPTRRWR